MIPYIIGCTEAKLSPEGSYERIYLQIMINTSEIRNVKRIIIIAPL